MSTLMPRAAKRLRITSPSSSPWICQSCQSRRAFTSSIPLPQQPQPQRQPQSQRSNRTREDEEKTTHFGFSTVAESLKASKVGEVFSSVSPHYDTMNDLMSLGIHRIWKDYFVRSLDPGITPSPTSPSSEASQQGQRVLDIAGGTGDIALRILDYATSVKGDNNLHVTISDINPSMLDEGRKRFAGSVYQQQDRVDFLEANAENLHTVPSESIDLYTVAFGIRNFTSQPRALAEAFRVLKPGGVFACLEFTPRPCNPVLNGIYKRWSFGAIPLIGQVVAGDRDSYQYLVESIERFPSQEVFAGMIENAGFLVPGGGGEGERKGWVDLSFGVAAVHKGVKPVR